MMAAGERRASRVVPLVLLCVLAIVLGLAFWPVGLFAVGMLMIALAATGRTMPNRVRWFIGVLGVAIFVYAAILSLDFFTGSVGLS